MNKRMVRQISTVILCWMMITGPVYAQTGIDFIQLYERGKLLLRQHLYTDAAKEFKRASYTTKGQKHFGVFFYLSIAYFRLSSIQNASRYLKVAKKLARKKRHKAAAARLENKIKSLYGSFKVMPEVDPDEVGRLKIKLVPKTAFSNKSKLRFFKRLNKKLLVQGIVPNNSTIYLPKGEYNLSLTQPQCLKYGLIEGNQPAKDLTISASSVQLKLRAGASCQCVGGQKLYRIGRKLRCSCPAGLGWNKKKQRCETAFNPVPVTLGIIGGTLAIGGLTVLLAIYVSNLGEPDAGKSTDLGNGIWGKKVTPPKAP